MIHQRDKLRLGPLRLRGANSKNDTESREYFQTQIRSKQCNQTIRPKQYNQRYGQSNQSNMVCNTIKRNRGVITLSIGLHGDLSQKLDVQEVDVGR